MVHYLDHAASTPVHPAAAVAMTEALTECYGNPSGSHRLARDANRRVDAARAQVAAAFGVTPGNIVFTSGGTEADSMAIHGSLRLSANAGRNGIAICSAVEHHAVLDPVEDRGGRVIGVDANGVIRLDHLRTTLETLAADEIEVAVVSVMAANNEIGVLQPVIEVASIVRELAPNALVHTDAVQFPAWSDTAQLAAAVDLMSVSGHKWGGPKGTGFLVIAAGVELPSTQLGGGQERGRRGGTQNVPGIVAIGAAAEAMVAERSTAVERVRSLRDDLIDRVLAGVHGAILTGAGAPRLPNIAHFSLPGIESEPLLFMIERGDVMASSASSCASGAQQASHVLSAMGTPASMGAIRLSLGYPSTADDVVAAADSIISACERIQSRG